MLGEPVAVVTQPIGGLGQGQGLADGVGGVAATADRGLVEDAEAEHGAGAYATKELRPTALRLLWRIHGDRSRHSTPNVLPAEV